MHSALFKLIAIIICGFFIFGIYEATSLHATTLFDPEAESEITEEDEATHENSFIISESLFESFFSFSVPLSENPFLTSFFRPPKA